MNITFYLTNCYEQKHPFPCLQNKANSNPIKPNLRKAKMNLSSVKTKDYRNELPLRPPVEQTQSNPIQTQFRTCRQKKKSQPENTQLASEEGDEHKLYVVGVVIQLNVEKTCIYEDEGGQGSVQKLYPQGSLARKICF